MKKLISAALLLSVVLLTGCTGLSGEKYHVDYCGQKDLYIGAKDCYRAGQQVTVYYDYRFIDTDTDYYFYLDGERLNCTYEESKGFVIRFTMPDRDVTLKQDSFNSMYTLETDTVTTRSEEETQEQTSPLKSLEELDSVSAGDHFTFGSYPQNPAPGTDAYDPGPIEWRVLEVRDGSALVISEYLLAPVAYDRELKDVTWETCYLRQWLNGAFYDSAFSESEKIRIQTVKNQNPDNPLYGTKGGGDTEDKVFCLSLEEARTYFKDSKERAAAPTAFAIKRGASTNNDLTLENGMKTGWWWLRSPASSSDRAADVDSYGSIDIDFVNGDSVDGDYVFDENNCVRPVILVLLSDK